MGISLSSRYDPAVAEGKWYHFWEEKGTFAGDPDSAKEPYCIMIPPPNVTGTLTMGHVLNLTLQDILIRWRRMEGRNAMWQPGCDHAAIATNAVVERELADEGLSRRQIGNEKFIERVWQKMEQNHEIITEQLKRLGCSLDWPRERFTLDEGLSKAVTEVFIALHRKGLIYRANYIVNWCVQCHTTLSDEEVEHQEEQGTLTWIRYPLEGTDEFVEVATTRPETMLGDAAVAVNPKDKRYKKLIGRTVILPLVDRRIPVVANELVDPEFGTGVVKVTPAHDPVDFQIARESDLPQVIVIGEDGRMTKEAGERYVGLDRFECRENVLADLKERKLLVKQEPHQHQVGHCYRCHTVVEPLASLQWWVKMKPLAEPALEVAKEGKVRFWPPRWTKVYFDWLEHVRDWPISRQICWGHRIPAYYCDECDEIIVSADKPERCTKCSSDNLRQEADTLDTWFSSWLWPFSTLGWPEQTSTLDTFYPTHVLVTAPDIIFFWVARMIMAGLEFRDNIPFSDVYLHGVVRDEHGRKMSKSLGNSPDPIAVMEEYGADALRFSIILITSQGQDVFYAEDKVKIGRNFANKVWNASRLVMMNLGDWREAGGAVAYGREALEFEDRWILSRFQAAAESLSGSLEKFFFNEAAHAIYDFFWHDYCDWYLEIIKPRLYQDEEAGLSEAQRRSRAIAQSTAATVLDGALRLLHPFAPYLTEEIWQHLGQLMPRRGAVPDARQVAAESIMLAPWPTPDADLRFLQVEAEMAVAQDVIRSVRNVRRDLNLPERQDLTAIVSAENDEAVGALQENAELIRRLAGVGELTIGQGRSKPEASVTRVLSGMQVFVPVGGLIDIEAEKGRLHGRMEKATSQRENVRRKLRDQSFVERAPEEVVARERAREEELGRQIEALEEGLRDLE